MWVELTVCEWLVRVGSLWCAAVIGVDKLIWLVIAMWLGIYMMCCKVILTMVAL